MVNHSTWRIFGSLPLLALILGACNPFAASAPPAAPSPLPLPSSTILPFTDTPAPTAYPTRNPALSTTPQAPPSPYMFWSDSTGVISVLKLDTGKTMTLLDPANQAGGAWTRIAGACHKTASRSGIFPTGKKGIS